MTAIETPRTIRDFGSNLPEALFDIQYKAPGSPEFADLILDLLAPSDAELDYGRGLDHGTWAVLSAIYPAADASVVQLSMDASKPISWHSGVGRALRPLREHAVLILGSGSVVHTLPQLEWNISARPHDWAERFNDLVINVVEANTPQCLFGNGALDEDAALSVPTPDLGHYWPLFNVLGSRFASNKLTMKLRHLQYKS